MADSYQHGQGRGPGGGPQHAAAPCLGLHACSWHGAAYTSGSGRDWSCAVFPWYVRLSVTRRVMSHVCALGALQWVLVGGYYG
jgi:hypothetical protein